MSSRDINIRMGELDERRKALEEALRGRSTSDPEYRADLEEYRSLGQVERDLANERLRSVEPRERVAASRVSEIAERDRLL